ncbi:hypothetical protein HTZ97_16240 [Desulfuromonas acetoxidans]|uniref:hypothetical protein n=1 Tax=Desulfuromonas acetoxidans TaxID=891 RepID=UPI00030C792A|nr:hypothetical protein [Desulfuromonas acetoxidans]MBF0646904.1 hypothetical protein [Desulfuromonas acetoxidans]NVD26181.1 hypothetical protein [Desulfuromonas acetoxidans]NVE18007.1 hypothetical protein [Desulfuromonas acetoxidans]
MTMGITDGDRVYPSPAAWEKGEAHHRELAAIKEYDVTTIGQLRNALKDLPDNMPCEDVMGEAILVTTGRKVVIS